MKNHPIRTVAVLAGLLLIMWVSSLPVGATTKSFDYNIPINYQEMTQRLHYFAERYPEIVELESLGQSHDGRELWLLRLGRGDIKLHINGSLHARERITTNIILKNLEEYTTAYAHMHPWIEGYHVRELLDRVTIYFVPMANPDGVDYTISGSDAIQNQALRTQLEQIRLTDDSVHFLPGLMRWKANVQGVDLNRQFPYGWEHDLRKDPGYPSDSMYKGEQALSEPEAQALYALQLNHPFMLSATYHTQGSVIFWYQSQDWLVYHKTRQLADKIASSTGFKSVPTETPGGGFTDWMIGSLHTPSVTMEFGKYQYDDTDFNMFYPAGRTLALLLAEEAIRLDQVASYEVRLDGKVVKRFEFPHHAYAYLQDYLAGTDSELRVINRTFTENQYLTDNRLEGGPYQYHPLWLLSAFPQLRDKHPLSQSVFYQKPLIQS